jgi:hypothetical protein
MHVDMGVFDVRGHWASRLRLKGREQFDRVTLG